MCGILGYSHSAGSLPAGLLATALEALAHRGPDHHGTFYSERMSLGATRLRILDLDAGDQPMFSSDRDVVVVFNGEIFNYPELLAELELEGYRFETRCDTEVVLNAFLCWGESCFSRLRGMFAIAIWVRSEGRLILVRDRMGIKPLYYCLQDGDIYFGSELKCILLHPAVRRNISLSGLNCFLSLNYVPGPLTLVEGVVKLMPGHSLEWQSGHCRIRSYVIPSEVNKAPNSSGTACEELDGLLSQALQEQLVSELPVGIWLSGGLDSSTILHYAAQAHQGPLQTYSVTFRGRSFDESKYIREVSRRFGTKHSEFDLSDSADLVDAIDRIAYYSDEPSADAGALPLWFLAQMTRRDVTVVLTGEGADELFGGYLSYRADRYNALARKVPHRLRKAALSLANLLPVSDEKISLEYKVKRFLQGSLLSPELAHVFWNGTFSEAEKQRLFLFADPGPLDSVLDTMIAGRDLQRYLDFDQRYYLPDDILYKVDRISMAHSLEVRPPFLDQRIVDFAASLPERLKLRGSQSKYVLRQLMKNKLPQTVLRRPKIGFDVPIHEWLRGVLRPLMLDTLSQEAVLATGLFHWPAVKQHIRAHLERRANLGYHLWGLIVLLIWMKRWKIELASEEARLLIPSVEVLDRAGLSS
jgi:asparagine synthase (glutamine-hydrolysing)